MKHIGVTLGSRAEEAHYDIPISYTNAVSSAGGLPVLLPNLPEKAEAYASMLDGLLLTGGGDIAPGLYGQEDRGSGVPDPARDAFELALLRHMIAQNKPVLGICRGCQLLCVGCGGTLVQDIQSQLGIVHTAETGVRHTVSADVPWLEEMLGSTFTVNSTHHQCVQELPKGFVRAAHTREGITEAIHAPGRPLWGVQWHPERLLEEEPRMLAIFRLLTD